MGIIPAGFENVVVTNHFVVYESNLEVVYPPYLIRLIHASFFKDYLWRKKVGSEGRKEVKINLFESTLIPIPDIEIQKKAVENWASFEEQRRSLELLMKQEEKNLDSVLLSGGIT